MVEPFLTVELADENATTALAEDVAARLATGDVIALSGDLGAGKTTFARALLRALAGDSMLEVPSPTFTLVQSYELPSLSVAHIDLYRVHNAGEIDQAGILDTDNDVLLIEWPERAQGSLPADRLDVALEMAGSARRARLSGNDSWRTRVALSRAVRAFLDGNGFPGAHRIRIPRAGIAGQQERVEVPGRIALLIAFAASQGPGGRTAGNGPAVQTTVAVNTLLRDAGLSAPERLAFDAAHGLLLVEDFGDEALAVEAAPVTARYFLAVEALAEIHLRAPTAETIGSSGATVVLPVLAGDALAAELAPFADAYIPNIAGKALTSDDRAEFERLWWTQFERLVEIERGLVLHDVDSRTLVWLPEREALAQIGFLAFPSAGIGPPAYDVASLCSDPEVTIPIELERDLCHHYVALRRAAHAHFDAQSFDTSYAILAALQATRNLGVLAGHGVVAPDDGRHARLVHYLRRRLAHPVLSALAVWYEGRIPAVS